MDAAQIIRDVDDKLKGAKQHFEEELKKLRTGRAHPSMLDGITVEAYGSPMPIIQVATITAPEPQLIQVTPFDPSNLQAIASAIRDNQALGLNPVDDGRVVRVPIPPLTSERREQIVKQLHEKVEESMIRMRNVRHEGIRAAEQLKNDKAISEDDLKRAEKQIDDNMSRVRSEIEALAKQKETDIMTV